MKLRKQLPLIAFLFIFLTNISGQTIDRGPYLQLVTTNSVYIHWRTDTATDSKVWYGDNPNNLTQTLSSLTNVTDHEILVPGLTPNTIYYYAVGNSNGEMAGGDYDHYFRTSPDGNEEVRIWVLGDAGTADQEQIDVRNGFYNYIGNNHIDGILLLGDNAYGDGTQEEYQQSWFENMYEDRLINSVMWSTFGNHDGNSANSNTQTGPYYDIFNFPKNAEAGGAASGTEAYYSFDIGNVHVISLNSHDIDDSANSPMMQWLQDDVNANDKDWLVAMFHHPAYTSSSSSMQTNSLPILEAGGADLVIFGHWHYYDRSFLINGHYSTPGSYDPATMALDEGDGRVNGNGAYTKTIGGEGTIYMVAGSSGKINDGSSPHDIMYHNANIHGSVDIQVNDLQMDVSFIDSTGAIEDYFTIIKQDGPPTVDITNPIDNEFFPTPESIVISADAIDNGSVTKVEFFIDNVSIGTDFNSPYSMAWTIPGNGNFEIKAIATDNDNFEASDVISVLVGDGAVCVQVNSSNDDAEEDDSGGMSITSGDLELIEESTEQVVGMRFTNLNIPQGATINSAYIQFTCDENVNLNPCNLDIYGEANNNAAPFNSNNFNISSRLKTSATALWSPAIWVSNGDKGPAQKTVDISPIIQELVDGPAFNVNSPIAIIIEGTGKREAESFNGSALNAPELCIEFSIGGPLPIELASFNARAIEKEIQLHWTTLSEINNDYFTVERSLDGRNFQEIGVVPGKGTTTEKNDYILYDRKPQPGLNYYRLKQTDFDGTSSYSQVVNAEIITDSAIKVYPSKVNDIITIEKSSNIKEELFFKIHDLGGKTYLNQTILKDEFKKEVSLTDLAPGVYFISIFNNNLIENFKIVKL